MYDDETWWLGAFYKNLVRISSWKVKVTGNKKQKFRHFVLELSSGARSSCGIFCGAVLWVQSSMVVGKSAHAV